MPKRRLDAPPFMGGHSGWPARRPILIPLFATLVLWLGPLFLLQYFPEPVLLMLVAVSVLSMGVLPIVVVLGMATLTAHIWDIDLE